MAISPLKTDARQLYDLLEQEDVTIEELATQVLAKSYELYEKRAKFALVTQVHHYDGELLRPGHPAARNAVVGMFSSQKAALNAGTSIAYSQGAQGAFTQCAFWVVPFTNETPAAWHKRLRTEMSDSTADDEQEARIRRIAESSKHVQRCEALYLQGNALHVCTLQHRHDGEHETHVDRDEDALLDSPRRLAQLPLDESEIDETDEA